MPPVSKSFQYITPSSMRVSPSEAVKAFQRDHGLTADGIAGAKTLVLLFGY